MTIAITGATGHLGRLAVDALKARVATSHIIALARDPAKAADLNVPVRAADYAQSQTLGPALAGVDTLLLISSSEIGQRTLQHQNVIDAAQAAGVQRIVYTSLLHADASPLSLAGEHLATEAAVKASGLAHTILRNGWYFENYTGAIPGALVGGAFIGAAGNGRISGAARADYALAAAVALTTPGHDGKVYELAGDVAFTLTELAAELSRQTGRTIPYRDLGEEGYVSALAGFGLPHDLAQAIAGWDVGASQGALFDDGHQLSALIGRPTTPLAAAVATSIR